MTFPPLEKRCRLGPQFFQKYTLWPA